MFDLLFISFITFFCKSKTKLEHLLYIYLNKKMKTKDKIIYKALELYNREGYNNITTRDIANSLGISSGNLHYHYKYSNEIVLKLFEQFADKMSKLLSEFINSKNKSILTLNDYVTTTINIFYDYKFIFLNFIDILRENLEIKMLYLDIYKKRKIEFEKLFLDFKESGIFRKDIPDFISSNIVEQMFIIGDNSMVYNDVTKKMKKEDAIKHYSLIFMNQFYFFMTSENQKIYEDEIVYSV